MGNVVGRAARGINWDRLSLVGALVIGVVFSLAYATGQVIRPYDLDCYWTATDFANLYADDWLDPLYCYVYPPVMAQLLYPFHVLPYAVVTTGWILLCFASLWVCLREWTLVAIGLGFVAIAIPALNVLGAGLGAVLLGNITMPMAAAIVLAMRPSPRWSPAWYAVPILTKLTAGVGLLWFLFRREWRPFAVGFGVTAAVALVSFVVSPAAWFEWVDFNIKNYGGPPRAPVIGGFPLRVIAGLLIVAWGARTNRRWPVAIAAGIALPALYGVASGVSVALAAYGIWRDGRRAANSTRTGSIPQPLPVG
jgi:hypothetical protein